MNTNLHSGFRLLKWLFGPGVRGQEQSNYTHQLQPEKLRREAAARSSGMEQRQEAAARSSSVEQEHEAAARSSSKKLRREAAA